MDEGPWLSPTSSLGGGMYVFMEDLSNYREGSHTLTIRAIDIDAVVHESYGYRSFIVQIASIGMPPTYRSVIPGNFTSAADIMSGNISISIEAFDDLGIETVNIRISTVNGVNPTNLNTPGDVDLSDVRIMSGFPKQMLLTSTSGDGWKYYTMTWDASTITSGLYLIEIIIGDVDDPQHMVTVKSLVIIKSNSLDDNPFADLNIPGSPVELIVGVMGISFVSIVLRRQKKNNR